MTDLPFEQWHPDAQRQCGFWWDLSPIACGQCERCRKEQRGHPVAPPTPQEPEQAQTLNDVFDVFETWARRKGATDTSSVSLGFWAFNEFHAIIGQPLRDWLLSRRASTPSPEGQTWQPIETAPKDTAVLLWLGWRFEIGHFNTGLGRWVANWDHRALEVPATHWMPLPSPPTPGGTKP